MITFKQSLKIGTISLLWLSTLAGAFYSGSRVGVRELEYRNAASEAAVIAYKLLSLEKGNVDSEKRVLEGDLDHKLALHADYIDSQWKWLWSHAKTDDQKYVKFAVQYRLTHPYEGVDFSDRKNINPKFSMDAPFVLELIEFQKEMAEKRQRVIDLYKGN